VKITTRLLGPLSALSGRPMSAQSATTYKTEGARPSTPFSQVATDQEAAVVRIEVTDTGVGMCRHDVVESKLFSSFSQTEQGRLQGPSCQSTRLCSSDLHRRQVVRVPVLAWRSCAGSCSCRAGA
jgi:hypothetical protein